MHQMGGVCVACWFFALTLSVLGAPLSSELADPPPTQVFKQPEASPSLPSGVARFSLSPDSVEPTARVPEKSPHMSTWIPSFLGEPKNIAGLATCVAIIFGGLFAFLRLSINGRWDQLAVQTLGTIFFFPTLILLGIYIELSRDAVTTILGAFVGYLFNQGTNLRSNRNGGD